jgi:alpha-L-fucosidase
MAAMLGILLLTGTSVVTGEDAPDDAQRLAEWTRMHESKADALAAFNEAKFGMFIHWGLYAIPGGVWKGERMEEGGVGPTVSEWVMRRKSIPRAEYTQLAQRFNPLRFDADQWADIAADAGMRYMVITATEKPASAHGYALEIQ